MSLIANFSSWHISRSISIEAVGRCKHEQGQLMVRPFTSMAITSAVVKLLGSVLCMLRRVELVVPAHGHIKRKRTRAWPGMTARFLTILEPLLALGRTPREGGADLLVTLGCREDLQ